MEMPMFILNKNKDPYLKIWEIDLTTRENKEKYKNKIKKEKQKLLEKEISNVISNYEPRAVLKNVNVVAQPDKNAYTVTLTFYIENSSIAQTITLLLERNR